jgi:RNA polymerase sigma factor (sigma-70 family)
MSDPSVHNQLLQDLLRRARDGDRSAREELFRSVSTRLEHLAHKMLKGFPAVRRWAEAGDLVQNAVLRLLRALDRVRPTTVADFFNLAAVHLRRALLDLARQARGPKGGLARRATDLADGDSDDGGYRPLDRADDPGELDRWYTFHRVVEKLPVEEREVVGLLFYHGWKHKDVADLLNRSERTVGRLWRSALKKLKADLKDC